MRTAMSLGVLSLVLMLWVEASAQNLADAPRHNDLPSDVFGHGKAKVGKSSGKAAAAKAAKDRKAKQKARAEEIKEEEEAEDEAAVTERDLKIKGLREKRNAAIEPVQGEIDRVTKEILTLKGQAARLERMKETAKAQGNQDTVVTLGQQALDIRQVKIFPKEERIKELRHQIATIKFQFEQGQMKLMKESPQPGDPELFECNGFLFKDKAKCEVYRRIVETHKTARMVADNHVKDLITAKVLQSAEFVSAAADNPLVNRKMINFYYRVRYVSRGGIQMERVGAVGVIPRDFDGLWFVEPITTQLSNGIKFPQ